MSRTRDRGTLPSDCLRVVVGLFVFAAGVHLTIFANIGLAPWDSLGMGMSYHLPLNYGLSMTAMAVAILAIDLAMGEKVGLGTVIDALLTGNFVQLFNDLNPLPTNESLVAGLAIMVCGFAVMAVGMKLYMEAGLGCGPRDALLVGLGRRLPHVPIGVVEIGLWSTVTLAGWRLGGPVGLGTLVAALGAGAVMQVVYDLIGFDPRDVTHRGLNEL
ncbi:MAG: hypothetical protein IJH42_00715 [Atopobiaceae bacterium]|nr:hypothetical protein [Atopobiaceae bacterium]